MALFVAPELLPDFDGCQLLPPTADSGAAAVVVGDMGTSWSYDSLNRAFRLLMAHEGPRPQLLSLGKSRCVCIRWFWGIRGQPLECREGRRGFWDPQGWWDTVVRPKLA